MIYEKQLQEIYSKVIEHNCKGYARITDELIHTANIDIIAYQKKQLAKKIAEDFIENKIMVFDLGDGVKELRFEGVIIHKKDLYNILKNNLLG